MVIRNSQFRWKDESAEAELRRTFRLRVDEEIRFRHGTLNLISGPTASGKTSLLMSLLGMTFLRDEENVG